MNEKSPDQMSRDMYQVGAQFLLATHRCLQLETLGERAPEQLEVPAIVNLAFAVEVLLKAILVRQQISYKSARHDLRLLYNLLPETECTHIRTRVESEFDDFIGRLESVASCFEDWRYVYERKTLTIDNYQFLFKLAHVAAGYVGNLVGFPPSAPFKLITPRRRFPETS